jgi:hypothetical protein
MKHAYDYGEVWFGLFLLLAILIYWLWGRQLTSLASNYFHRWSVWMVDRENPHLQKLAVAAHADGATHFDVRVKAKGLSVASFFRGKEGLIEVCHQELESGEPHDRLGGGRRLPWKPLGELSVPKAACPIKWLLEKARG